MAKKKINAGQAIYTNTLEPTTVDKKPKYATLSFT